MECEGRAPNTFAQRSDEYAQVRPRYPRALFDWIRENAAGRDAAWDCATGNGQAAVDLAPSFKTVQATDVSSEQISQGLASPNIVYSKQPAEQTDFPAQSFDLVTVAQALHWFDYAKFWPEVARVAKPGALFCTWGYAWFDCDPEVLQNLVLPLRELVAPFWAQNNRILWDRYRDEDIALPFDRIAVPQFVIDVSWTVDQLIAYMQTWSAYKRAPLEDARRNELSALIVGAKVRFAGRPAIDIVMPLATVAARIACAHALRTLQEEFPKDAERCPHQPVR
jgi:SAM-dependent methyltransferase